MEDSHLILMTEVQTYPLWLRGSDGIPYDIEPVSVLKSHELINDLEQWDNLYQKIMQPILDGSMSSKEHDEWVSNTFDDKGHDEKGKELAQRIANDTGKSVEYRGTKTLRYNIDI